MSEEDALLAAICSDPDEDTLRLAYADWLEEHDCHEQAVFMRMQIELARCPAWEPFAVMCKRSRPDWYTGTPFRITLPKVDGFHIEWHPAAFHRGLGYRLNIRSLVAWEQTEARVLNRAPIGEMHLWAATLEDWLRFSASPVVPRLRKLHFVNSPIEPLRVLRDLPSVRGVTDIYFERAGGAGMPVVVEELFRSGLGQVVRGLHFHIGYESLDDLIDSLHTGPGLERLSFSVMGLTSNQIERLGDGPTLSRLIELSISDEPFGNEGVRLLSGALPNSLRSLRLSAAGGQADGLEVLARSERLTGLRRLDLSRNQLAPRAAKVLAASRILAGLRSLDLHGCRIGDKGIRSLTRAKFWENLVELDLRGNPISAEGVRHLLDAELPRELTALVLDGEELGGGSRADLQRKYGDRLVIGV
jgi:uncharacterized protein (TIGR02996 family)